jgi:two-component system copper resistance phosphate regulon response regulator CusR
VLTEEEFIVDVATDGDQGLHRAKSISFDLIILDVMLPSRDGW